LQIFKVSFLLFQSSAFLYTLITLKNICSVYIVSINDNNISDLPRRKALSSR